MATIPSIAMIPSGYKASKVYSVLPTDGAGDLTFSRAGALPSFNATRVNSEGLIEEVLSNVPRLDYSDGGCPSLLIEPESRNLALRSEEFDNAYWTKTRSSITANATTSPDGTINADKLVENTDTNSHFIDKTFTTVATTIYTYSIFAKKSEREFIALECLTTGKGIIINLNDGSLGTRFGYLVSDINVETLQNGWFRISVKDTSPSTVLRYITSIGLNSTTASYTGDGTSGIFIWGAQLEALPYATSYIPTVASTVTRVAETVSKTGISSLIGQTEGTIFLDAIYDCNTSSSARWFDLKSVTQNIGIATRADNNVRIIVNGQSDLLTSAPISTTGLKIALVYNPLGVKVFINGTQYVLTNGGGQIMTSLTEIAISSQALDFALINSVQVYKTALSDLELIALTTL
jgi:hypothetical protein